MKTPINAFIGWKTLLNKNLLLEFKKI